MNLSRDRRESFSEGQTTFPRLSRDEYGGGALGTRALAPVGEDGLAAGPGLQAGSVGGELWLVGLSRAALGRRAGGAGSEQRLRDRLG